MSMLGAMENMGFAEEPKKKAPRKKASKKPSEPKPARTGRLKSREPKDYIESIVEDGEELADLRRESNKAKLLEPILKNEKLSYINEQQKLSLLKESGKVMETSFGEFLYFGYMEKLNIDILMMLKKLKPKIDNLVKERDTDGVIKVLKKEYKSILDTVKKSQEKDVKAWKKEH